MHRLAASVFFLVQRRREQEGLPQGTQRVQRSAGKHARIQNTFISSANLTYLANQQ